MSIAETIKKYVPEGTQPTLHGNLIMFEVGASEFASVCENLLNVHDLPLKTMTATDAQEKHGRFRIFTIFGVPGKNVFIAPYILLKDREPFGSLTGVMPQAHLYEREIKEFFGMRPDGHPNPNRWLLHANWPEGMYPLRKDFEWNTRPADTGLQNSFSVVEGEGIFEIPVGPVHAGIIEPGHFRFSMAGEEIVGFEPRLGFVHKGIEKLFETLSLEKKVILSEHVSGDTSFTHSLAFCQVLESLAGLSIPERAQYLRVIFSELERLANHIGDIGLMLLGTAFNFGSSYGARLREVILQIHERLTGSRFLRGVNCIGGVTKDIDTASAAWLGEQLDIIEKEFVFLMGVVDKNLTIFNRLSKTGTLPFQTAKDLGAVGVVARGSGIASDARKDFPYAAYAALSVDVATEQDGDIYARFRVRVKETYASCALIREALSRLPSGPLCTQNTITLAQDSYAVSVAEGWRGDIVYFVSTNSSGDISRVHVRDASFLNWPLFIQFAPGNVVLDFPLMNKSCNLSYSGNDK
jgi:Ni,Fe-hydrogenase III large subunit/Ni,Fe-hydrogenase III component G